MVFMIRCTKKGKEKIKAKEKVLNDHHQTSQEELLLLMDYYYTLTTTEEEEEEVIIALPPPLIVVDLPSIPPLHSTSSPLLLHEDPPQEACTNNINNNSKNINNNNNNNNKYNNKKKNNNNDAPKIRPQPVICSPNLHPSLPSSSSNKNKDHAMAAALDKDRDDTPRLRSRHGRLKDDLQLSTSMADLLQHGGLLESQAKLAKTDASVPSPDTESVEIREKDGVVSVVVVTSPPLPPPLQPQPPKTQATKLAQDLPSPLPLLSLPAEKSATARHSSKSGAGGGGGPIRGGSGKGSEERSWPGSSELSWQGGGEGTTPDSAARTGSKVTSNHPTQAHQQYQELDSAQSNEHEIRYLQRRLATLQGKIESTSGTDKSAGSHPVDRFRTDKKRTDRRIKGIPSTNACRRMLRAHCEENESLPDKTFSQRSNRKGAMIIKKGGGGGGGGVVGGKEISMSEKKRFAADRLWDHDMTMVLLTMYEEVWASQNHGYLRLRDWERVTSMLNEKTHQSLEPAQLRNKIDNMKKQYKKERQLHSRPGVLPSSWIYFDVMHAMLSKASVRYVSGGLDGLGVTPITVDDGEEEEDDENGGGGDDDEEEEEEEEAPNRSASFHNWVDIGEMQAAVAQQPGGGRGDDIPTCEDNAIPEPIAAAAPPLPPPPPPPLPTSTELTETDGDNNITPYSPSFHGQKLKRRRKLSSDKTKDIAEALESLAEAIKETEWKRLAMEKARNDYLMAINEQRLHSQERMDARREEMALKMERLRQEGQIEMLRILANVCKDRSSLGPAPSGNSS